MAQQKSKILKTIGNCVFVKKNRKFCSCALDCSVAHIVSKTMTISIQNSIALYQTLWNFGKKAS